MKVRYSSYLKDIDISIVELQTQLNKYYDYVSILATDVKGSSFRVAQKQKSVGDRSHRV